MIVPVQALRSRSVALIARSAVCSTRARVAQTTLLARTQLFTRPRTFSTTTLLRATEALQQQTSKAATPAKTAKEHTAPSYPRRSMLYVPGSSDKMIKKSQQSDADCIIFDLEDSVAAHRKGAARESVLHGLNAAPRPGPELAVRINPPSSAHDLASDDLDVVLPCRALNTIVIPKVEALSDVNFLLERVKYHRCHNEDGAASSDYAPLSLVLSVESAQSLLRMPSIIEGFEGARKRIGLPPGNVFIGALLFASEDYCASTGIIRTRSRKELLFPRANMATIAKAYDVQAIDMVCIDYKDAENLVEESTEARQMGYDGKQAIHPNQVEGIQRTFSPSEAEVDRAARIKAAYEKAVAQNNAGAVGFAEKEGGSMIMIDAPMLKQADVILSKAAAAGVAIPQIDSETAQGKSSSETANTQNPPQANRKAATSSTTRAFHSAAYRSLANGK